MSDLITLCMENKKIQCERSLLIENSDYFRAMLNGSFMESSKNIITINDIKYDAMVLILKLLRYPNEEIPEESLLPLFQAALLLLFTEIQIKCEQIAKNIISFKNCLDLWLFAAKFDQNDLLNIAKLTAFLNFDKVKDTNAFLELKPAVLLNYIGSCYLYYWNQEGTWQAIKKWWLHNSEAENIKLDLEFRQNLIKCISYDFGNCSKNIIPQIGHFFSDLKNSYDVGRKKRNLKGSPCILVNSSFYGQKRKHEVLKGEHFYSVRYFENCELALKPVIFLKSLQNLEGFRIIGHKEKMYVFGGEFKIGSGRWNRDVLEFDLLKNTKIYLPRLPFERRHFQACISDNYLYVFGGTGRYRELQNNFFYFNFETLKWSDCVNFPSIGTDFRVCMLLNRFYLFAHPDYIFYYCNDQWQEIGAFNLLRPLIRVDTTLMVSEGDRIFIKDACQSRILVMIYHADSLNMNGFTTLIPKPSNDIFQSESVICDGILYTLNRHRSKSDHEAWVSYSAFRIDTNEVLVHEKALPNLNITSLSIFTVFHPNMLDNTATNA